MDINSPDQPIAEARANITEILNATKLLRRTFFFTSRGTRQAAIVPLEVGELVHQIGARQAVKLLAGETAAAPEAAPEAPRRALPAPTVPDHATRLVLNQTIPEAAYNHVRALAWDRPGGHPAPEEYSLLVYNIAVAAGLLK